MNAAAQPAPPDVGDLLLQQGILSEKQLELVRRRQTRLAIAQHQAIVDLNYASEEDTYRALATLNNLQFTDLSDATLDKALLEHVPLKLIFNNQLIPLALTGDVLTVAVAEPPKPIEQGNLRLLLNKRFQFVITSPCAIHATLRKQFGLV